MSIARVSWTRPPSLSLSSLFITVARNVQPAEKHMLMLKSGIDLFLSKWVATKGLLGEDFSPGEVGCSFNLINSNCCIEKFKFYLTTNLGR